MVRIEGAAAADLASAPDPVKAEEEAAQNNASAPEAAAVATKKISFDLGEEEDKKEGAVVDDEVKKEVEEQLEEVVVMGEEAEKLKKPAWMPKIHKKEEEDSLEVKEKVEEMKEAAAADKTLETNFDVEDEINFNLATRKEQDKKDKKRDRSKSPAVVKKSDKDDEESAGKKLKAPRSSSKEKKPPSDSDDDDDALRYSQMADVAVEYQRIAPEEAERVFIAEAPLTEEEEGSDASAELRKPSPRPTARRIKSHIDEFQSVEIEPSYAAPVYSTAVVGDRRRRRSGRSASPDRIPTPPTIDRRSKPHKERRRSGEREGERRRSGEREGERRRSRRSSGGDKDVGMANSRGSPIYRLSEQQAVVISQLEAVLDGSDRVHFLFYTFLMSNHRRQNFQRTKRPPR